MTDPNLGDFYGRIARIEKARAKGQGFEATGTLGRSHYHRPAKRRSVLPTLLLVLACGFGLKATIHYKVGAGVYDARVQGLLNGQGFDRLAGALMQADPVTLFLSDRIGRALQG